MAEKVRLIVIVKGVGGERRLAFDGLIVAELDQLALDGVNLRQRRRTG